MFFGYDLFNVTVGTMFASIYAWFVNLANAFGLCQ